MRLRFFFFLLAAAFCVSCGASSSGRDLPATLTPAPGPEPRIQGPSIFGARPGSPFLYRIAATGERPMQYSATGLPEGLSLDVHTGQISGRVAARGKFPIALQARNARGSSSKKLRILVGDQIALTPPMGWNSWNCWAGSVDQEKVLKSARAMVSSRLIDHGWTYVNIDDAWQGPRGGPFGGLQGNNKFPDMKKLCDEIHAMGLKAGIYSTPWITSYARYPGGSSDNPAGTWSKELASDKQHRHGKYSFATNDARQWAEWGFDYLKYDWAPNDVEHTSQMSKALRESGRDIVFSLSNSAPFEHAADWARLANCWRTTGDIWDRWQENSGDWQYGVSEIGFIQDRWAPFAGPGHWNDPDMLVVGHVGWGPALHLSKLSADEQYSHLSLWCLLSAPLLIGCDMDRLDPFTLGLLSNDEVLAIDQDALGKPALHVGAVGAVDVFAKDLEDGSKALGFFNRASQAETVTYNKLARIGLAGKRRVRDLWRQKDLETASGTVKLSVPGHGVMLLKLSPAR
jgi:alpha-galactosidase